MSVDQKQYDMWYRTNGIRHGSSLVKPTFRDLSSLVFPLDSIVHLPSPIDIGSDDNGDDDNEKLLIGPAANDPLIRIAPIVVVDIHNKYGIKNALGRPIITTPNTLSEIRSYIATDSKLKDLKVSASFTNSNKNLILSSYTMVNSVYKYPMNYKSGWYTWYNLHATVYKNVEKLYNEYPSRNQFIIMECPILLPSLSMLNRLADTLDVAKSPRSANYIESLTDQHIKLFKTDRERLLIDLWLYVSRGPEYSMIGCMLKSVPSIKINLMWIVGGKYVTINLQRLVGFIKGADESSTKGTYTRKQMEKGFLVFMMRLAQSISLSGNLDNPEEDEDLDDEDKFIVMDDPSRNIDIDASKVSVDRLDVKLQNTASTQRSSRPRLSDSEAMEKLKQEFDRIDKGIDDQSTATEMDDSDAIEEAVMDRDLEQLEAIQAQRAIEDTYDNRYSTYVPPDDSLESGVNDEVDKMAKRGLLSPKEVARLKKVAMNYKTIKDPYGKKGTLENAIKIDPEDLKVPEKMPLTKKPIPGVRDSGMANSTISQMGKLYDSKILHADVMQSVMHLQRLGYAIEDYNVTKTYSVIDRYEEHTIKTLTPKGNSKMVRFKIPILDEDGSMLIGGIKSRMRDQYGEKPIIKISDNEVVLTSYVSKIFVTRTSRAAFNYELWLTNQLKEKILSSENSGFTEVEYGNVFNHQKRLPRVYTIISKNFVKFRFGGYLFNFNYDAIPNFFDDATGIIAKKHRLIPFAKGREVLFLDIHGSVFASKNGELAELGSMESIFQIDEARSPVDYVEYPLLGDKVPLGVVLAYHIGLGNLLETIKAKHRRVNRGSKYDLQPNEYMIKFEDEVLILDRRDAVPALLLSGFNRYKSFLNKSSIYHFDTKEIYGTLLEANKISSKKLIDLDILFKGWVEHITRGLLIEMKMPTDLFSLLLVATKMLSIDHHSTKGDRTIERDKGHERIAGAIYNEFYRAARKHQSSAFVGRTGLDINPSAVWMKILTDSAVMGVEESNPIHHLKEQEELILGGTGGRSTRTLTGEDRRVGKSAAGTISEATVDSAEVGAKVFRSADPSYVNLRGTIKPVENIKDNCTRVFSTSAMLAPGANFDDPKRINFINVQNSSTTFAKGYTPMPMRTGYERVIGHRTGKLWATMAKDDGVVESIKSGVIRVKYQNGDTTSIQLGTRHGKWSGKVVPHEIVTDLKVGDKLEADEPIAYNKHWFTRDSLYADQVVHKSGVLARMVMWESDTTYEDSCAISPRLSRELETSFSKPRFINVPFDHEIRNLVKVGDVVKSDDVLCTLFPPMSMALDRHEEVAQEILNKLSNETPKAKTGGRISAINILYSGEMEDMTPSLRDLVDQYNVDLFKRCKQMKEPAYDAFVDSNLRVNGTEIGNDVVSIEVVIDYDLSCSGGDKVVVGNQMKSVPASVIQGTFETEEGVPLDLVFSIISAEKRIVRSIYIMGTTNRLLHQLGRDACKEYFGENVFDTLKKEPKSS